MTRVDVAHAAARARAKARRQALRDTGEEMLALIRLHVVGCPRCKVRICSEGMAQLLLRLDERLGAAGRAAARAGATRRGAGRPKAPR